MDDSIEVPLPDPDQLPGLLRGSPHWITWKAERREDKINKVPCDRAGYTASMNGGHMTLADALKSALRLRKVHRSPRFGVGYQFTEGCGLVGVDIDKAIANGVRADHLAWFLETYPTWAEFSVSGTGVHQFFAGAFSGKRTAKIPEEVDGAVEFRKAEVFGGTGFIAVTGRVIPDTPVTLAGAAPVVDTLTPFFEPVYQLPPARPITARATGSAADSNIEAWGRAGLERQCSLVRNAPNGHLHFALASAACSVGRLVPHAVSWDDAESALYDAAKAAGGKDMNNAMKTIRGQLEFGGTDPSYPAERFSVVGPADPGDVDLSEFGLKIHEPEVAADELAEEVQEEAAPEVMDPGPFPEHLLAVPGFVGKVIEFTNTNSLVLQPILALGGALALLSVLTGRKVKDKYGSRTNLYVLSIAKSGEGKDQSRRTNKRILDAAGASVLVGSESWASGPGLIAAVAQTPAVLFQNDEIGRFLQTTSDPKKAPHLFSCISILLKLYSSADDVFIGDAYADATKQTKIAQPHAVVYGTTVPGSFYAAMSEDAVTNGFLGRLLVFEAPNQQQPIQEPEPIEPTAELVETARKWFNWNPGGGNFGSIHPKPFVVPSTPEAEAVFRELRAFSRDQRAILGDVLGSLWVRAAENARKLALLYACSENFGEAAVVTVEAAEWACTLTQYLVRRQCWDVNRFVARNQTESESLEMLRLIASYGDKGITGTQLLKRTRHLKKRDREDTLQALIDGKEIDVDVIKTLGRSTKVYKSIRTN